MTRVILVASMLVLLTGVSPAQEPPSWVKLSELPNGATIVRDIIEIPGTDTLVACGMDWAYDRTWWSPDGGQTWQSGLCNSGRGFPQLAQDPVRRRIWVVDSWQDSSVYYSDDNGRDWTGVSQPAGSLTGVTIEVAGDYLYYGGSVSSPYSICLYRLHQDSLVWEMVTQYPECNAITRLKYNNGKLLVFARDTSGLKTRVFSYTP